MVLFSGLIPQAIYCAAKDKHLCLNSAGVCFTDNEWRYYTLPFKEHMMKVTK